MASEIRILKREEIETSKWDGCIYYAPNSRIYAYTWYLDSVCDEWFGIVENEYEAVMPIVVKTKKWLNYREVYHPFNAQQLGLFSMSIISQNRLKKFLEAIPSEYKHIYMQLNFGNFAVKQLNTLGFEIESKPNYILSLAKPYEEIHAAYSSNLKRKLQKASQEHLLFNTDLKPEEFVDLARQYFPIKEEFTDEVYYALLRIIYNCAHRGKGLIYAAFDMERNFLAATFILFDGTRLVNLVNISSPLGKEKNAMAILFDGLIKGSAGQLKILDFEGSKLDGVAQFYQSFGAVNEPYFSIKKDMRPWYAKLIKK